MVFMLTARENSTQLCVRIRQLHFLFFAPRAAYIPSVTLYYKFPGAQVALIEAPGQDTTWHFLPVDYDHRSVLVRLAEWCFCIGGWI
jgi:hypothetical protein